MSSSGWSNWLAVIPPVGRCHWTLELLADEMVVLGLVKKVSTETVT